MTKRTILLVVLTLLVVGGAGVAEALGVPEPASLTLFACGAAGLALVVWRRRRVAAA